MARKTANDWRKAHADAEAKLNRIENQITMRLLELCERHPDVPVARNADMERTIVKAKSIANPNYLTDQTIDIQIRYIEIIEEHLDSLHPHQQQKLFN